MVVPKGFNTFGVGRRFEQKAEPFGRGLSGMVGSTGSDIVSRLPSVARSNDAGDSKTCPHAFHSELTREFTVPEAVDLDNEFVRDMGIYRTSSRLALR